MYKLKIEAKSGTDLRNQLLALLGETGVTVTGVSELRVDLSETLSKPQLDAVLEAEKAISNLDNALNAAEEKEPTKRTRRTKEQIAADQAAEKEEVEETAKNLEHSESPNLEVKKEKTEQGVDSSFSQQDLINQAIKLGAGKKEDIRSILKDYGVDKIPALDAKDYLAFMQRLKGLENQAAA